MGREGAARLRAGSSEAGNAPLSCEEIHKDAGPLPGPADAAAVKHIADSTVRRLSLYLRYLEEFEARGQATISSTQLAERGHTTSAQVRKDLSFFGSFGKRGLGYSVPELEKRLRRILGLETEWRVAIVGMGKIGAALASYGGFRQRGFRIAGLYDDDPAKIGKRIDAFTVRAAADFARDAQKQPVDIAVLTVPAGAAQQAADAAVAAGVRGIMNFAPVQLTVPATVALRNVNMALELEGLAFALTNPG
ncbi:MAG TPA: redox-sensing transcriptional repressor Rex [Gemmatimonadaceae bacterium]|nr:redox-sensing transcriptional repressor Rex [Gemmatimonadaceae bacterium]